MQSIVSLNLLVQKHNLHRQLHSVLRQSSLNDFYLTHCRSNLSHSRTPPDTLISQILANSIEQQWRSPFRGSPRGLPFTLDFVISHLHIKGFSE